MIKAVLFDFGGVILTSPFEAFNRYEASKGLPADVIRTINATNPDDNAWAKLERSDVDVHGFAELFEQEAAAIGHEINGRDILGLLSGEVRPRMAAAVAKVRAEGFITACLTNNFLSRESGEGKGSGVSEGDPARNAVMAQFHEVIESSRIGIRKPELGFYEKALELLEIEASDAVFLDDLGINLKPAKAMGMTTIKVGDPDVALAELSEIIGVEFD
ncbi:MAG: HAD-IA family hydrolase [Acidimicrobiales bacterium]